MNLVWAALIVGAVTALADGDADRAPEGSGSWYVRALAGLAPPRNWPLRTATLIWRSFGGSPPDVTTAI